MSSFIYRGFDVEDHGYGCFSYFKAEWDLGDPCGTARSAENAKAEIDEYWWEQDDPVEIEQFDGTVAGDFNSDITESAS